MENEKIFELMEKMYVDLKTGQEKMYSELKSGQEKMYSELKTDIREVKNAVIKIENEHGKKLDALFGG